MKQANPLLWKLADALAEINPYYQAVVKRFPGDSPVDAVVIERFQGISAVFAIVAGQWYFKHIMVDPDGDPYPDGSDAEPMGASEDRVDLIVATIVAMDLDTYRHVLETNDDPTLRQWAERGFAQLLLSRQG